MYKKTSSLFVKKIHERVRTHIQALSVSVNTQMEICMFVYMCICTFKVQTHTQLFVRDKIFLSLSELIVLLK